MRLEYQHYRRRLIFKTLFQKGIKMDLSTAKVFLDFAIKNNTNPSRQKEQVLTTIELLAIDLAHEYYSGGRSKESAKAAIVDAVSERIDALFS